MPNLPSDGGRATRRAFLQTSTVAAASLAAHSAWLPRAHAAGSDRLKVGLVGCGGRGTGAAVNALKADSGAVLTAMGDMFADRLQSSLAALKSAENELDNRVQVEPDQQHVGVDAFQRVIDSGVDVVVLASPPHFRPAHLRAAITAGKHVFAEKPVAVDGPGVRSVFDTVALARDKRLSIVSGLCWRYDLGMRATFEQIHAGGVGEISTIQVTYHTNTLKKFPRQPAWSDMEFQLRNWQHLTWLSGDFNVEQHVHSLDKALWAQRDEPPLRASGIGGRQARTGAESGDVYDHFGVAYEYANGVKVFASCRQMDHCANDVSDHVFGTKGRCDVMKHTISGETPWKFKGSKGDMYQNEHNELFAAIRKGEPVNNGDYMTKSTLMAILGRMCAYTGKTITWDEALNSKENLSPPSYDLGPFPMPPVAIPGVTKFS